jgi:hypothetical protein
MLTSSSRKQKSTVTDAFPKKTYKTKLKTKTKTMYNKDDDSSDVTEASLPKKKPKETKSDALFIRITFCLPVETEHPHERHVDLLKFLMQVNGPQLVVYNKRHKILRASAIEALGNTQMHQNHFNINSIQIGRKKDGVLYTVIQELQTQHSVETLKKQPGVLDFLKTQKIKIYHHKWKPEEWNVRSAGFLPRFSPLHHPKEMVVKSLNTRFKTTKNMPEFCICKMTVFTHIYNILLKIQVYAVEINSQNLSLFNKLMMKNVNHPEEYIPFQMQRANKEAYSKAIAYTAAQFQHDMRTIAIDNVSEEAHFVLEHQAMLVPNILHVYHLPKKASMRIVVHIDDFPLICKEVKHLLHNWIEMLEPSDIRNSGEPRVATIGADDYSDNNLTQISIGVESMLSVDMTEFTILNSNPQLIAIQIDPYQSLQCQHLTM